MQFKTLELCPFHKQLFSKLITIFRLLQFGNLKTILGPNETNWTSDIQTYLWNYIVFTLKNSHQSKNKQRLEFGRTMMEDSTSDIWKPLTVYPLQQFVHQLSHHFNINILSICSDNWCNSQCQRKPQCKRLTVLS